MNDISPDWKGSTPEEVAVLDEILRYEATPLALLTFARLQDRLGDYWYWFTLSTLWVSYSGHSDLNLWRRLFQAARPGRKTSIMKPSELRAFNELPNKFTAYRALRPNETDWISYTVDKALADRWALERGGYVQAYTLNKLHCLALLLRRGESEILMIDKKKAMREDG